MKGPGPAPTCRQGRGCAGPQHLLQLQLGRLLLRSLVPVEVSGGFSHGQEADPVLETSRMMAAPGYRGAR